MNISNEQLIEMLHTLDVALKMQDTLRRGDPNSYAMVGPSVAELAATRLETLLEEIKELEKENMDIKINEVDVQRLDLQPDEVLIVKVRSDEITGDSLNSLSNGFKSLFPNNKVAVLGVGEEGNIDLTVAKGSEYPETQFCSDCSCGKKAAYEGDKS